MYDHIYVGSYIYIYDHDPGIEVLRRTDLWILARSVLTSPVGTTYMFCRRKPHAHAWIEMTAKKLCSKVFWFMPWIMACQIYDDPQGSVAETASVACKATVTCTCGLIITVRAKVLIRLWSPNQPWCQTRLSCSAPTSDRCLRRQLVCMLTPSVIVLSLVTVMDYCLRCAHVSQGFKHLLIKWEICDARYFLCIVAVHLLPLVLQSGGSWQSFVWRHPWMASPLSYTFFGFSPNSSEHIGTSLPQYCVHFSVSSKHGQSQMHVWRQL